MIVVPSVCLAVGFAQEDIYFRNASATLLSSECTNEGKARFERAWTSAHTVLDGCSSALANMTGAAPAETRQLIRIQDCAGYAEGRSVYQSEWRYFEYMERE